MDNMITHSTSVVESGVLEFFITSECLFIYLFVYLLLLPVQEELASVDNGLNNIMYLCPQQSNTWVHS